MSEGRLARGFTRLADPPEPDLLGEDDAEKIVVVSDEPGMGEPRINPDGTVSIDTPDGGVVINLRPPPEEADEDDDDWFANLADKIDDDVRNRIVEEVLRGVAADDESRQEWLEMRAEGIKMLGTSLEKPKGDVGNSTGPFEGMSTIRHPLLLEAITRFQANAAGELYPPSGPVKVRDDRPVKPAGVAPPPGIGHNGGPALEEQILGLGGPAEDAQAVEQASREEIAEALERGFNHNLTVGDRGYRPDKVKMLFWVAFGGCGFVKVYDCPIRDRPVSRFVDASDVIVSNAASEIGDAGRLTHRIKMRQSLVKRMQILGVYRDVDLHDPQSEPNAQEEAVARAQGLEARPQRIEDQDRTMYESYVELDVAGYEHRRKDPRSGEDRVTGLELPWKVTIDKDSREMLELRRNWEQDDDTFRARRVFVKYGFVPAMGFYDLGLLHLIGNGDQALTAAWREALDAGMYANFPGTIHNEAAIRNWTNQNRIPPGGSLPVKGLPPTVPLKNVIEFLPYKDVTAGFVALIQHIEQRMDRVAGTAELPVGEGHQDAPVGTTLALIEQATKVLAAAHIGLHASQAEELELLKERYKANPESFWRWNKKGYDWEEAVFLRALEDCEIVPAADPNTPSHMHRLMKWYALVQLAIQQPILFNLRTLIRQVAIVLGISDPDTLIVTEEQYAAAQAAQAQAAGGKQDGAPDPARMAAIQQKAQQAQQEHEARLQEMGMKLQQTMAEHDARMKEAAMDTAAQDRDRQVQGQIAVTESADRAADRASRERVANTRLETEREKVQAQDLQHQRDTFIRPHVEQAAKPPEPLGAPPEQQPPEG